MFRKIITIGILASAMLFGCKSETETKSDKDSMSVGGTAFRNGDLMTEDINLGEMAKVDAAAPGTSVTLDRSFENAPPMIPHNIEGFLPITLKNNMCLTCHKPDVAKAMNATPMPVSHFTDYRPEIKKDGDKYHLYDDNEVVAKDLKDKMSLVRYSCNQCHVPQTNASVVLKNVFEPDYRVEKSKSGSNLNENISEGVK